MIRVGIIGGAGYVGGEVIRLILNHPSCELVFVQSTSQSGKPLHSLHQDLTGHTDLVFQADTKGECDVLFLCSGHGHSTSFVADHSSKDQTIIDLSRDFRINPESFNFVYGLSELNRKQISMASRIANPGCFATCIQLGLLPLANHQSLQSDIHVTAITGATGAGSQPSSTTHFSWRDNNVSVYKAFRHQHLDEILQSMIQLQPDFDQQVNFIPVRGNFSRGIMASIYLDSDLSKQDVVGLFKSFYKRSPFVHVCEESVSLKSVVNTNNCFLHIEKYDKKLHIISVLDNLLKGAAGQAVQNMNIIFALPEDEGLKLKATLY